MSSHFIQMADGEVIEIKADDYIVRTHKYEVPCFVWQYAGFWQVCECSTGGIVGRGVSKKDAELSAERRIGRAICKHGWAGFWKYLEKHQPTIVEESDAVCTTD